MPALKANEISGFLKSPPKTVEAVLIYGPDAGLVNERAITLAKTFAARTKPEGEIIVKDDADLAAEHDRLNVELQTMSMFGGRQVIRLKAGTRLNPKTLEEILKDPLQADLVIEAGDLKKTAKLRTIFEKSKSSYAIPCYADDTRSLSDLIREEFSSAKKTIGLEAANHLKTLLGADRSLSRSELQKLILYVQDHENVTVDDIDAVIGDSASLAIDSICYAVTDANDKQAIRDFDRAIAAGHAPQTITTALGRHIMTLFHVRAAMESGESLDSAMRKLRPPIFFKRRAEFQSQCRRWNCQSLTRALSLTQETLVRCRTSPELERAYAERLLLAVGRLGV